MSRGELFRKVPSLFEHFPKKSDNLNQNTIQIDLVPVCDSDRSRVVTMYWSQVPEVV
jgi:hypothetical protein